MKKQNPDPRASVIIVDDAGVIGETCSRALGRAGFYVRAVTDPLEAFALFRKEPAHAALLDLRMPGMTGLELMRVLRDMWPGTEVVVMTAYPDSLMVNQCLELGALAVMSKPFENMAQVVQNAGRAVVRSRLRQRLPIDGGLLLRLTLVETGVIEPADLDKALLQAEREGGSPRKELAAAGAISEDGIEAAVMEFAGAPRLSLADHQPDLDLARKIPFEMIRRHLCLPLYERGEAVCFIAADPFNDRARNELEAALERPVVLFKGDRLEINEAIARRERELNKPVPPLSELIERLNSGPGDARETLAALLLQPFSRLDLSRAELEEGPDGKLVLSFSGAVTVEQGELAGRRLDGRRPPGPAADEFEVQRD